MPIYEYRCHVCGHQFEEIQKVSDNPLKTCPRCGEPEARKLVSKTSFQLKGSGWYVTDFKNNTKKAKEDKQQDKPEEKPLKEEVKKPENSTESKKDVKVTKKDNES